MSDVRPLHDNVWGSESVIFEDDGTFHYAFEGRNDEIDRMRMIQRNDGSNGFGPSREWREIASLDPVEAMNLAAIWGVKPLSREFDDLFLGLLQSPDYYRLKTADGRVPKRVHK